MFVRLPSSNAVKAGLLDKNGNFRVGDRRVDMAGLIHSVQEL